MHLLQSFARMGKDHIGRKEPAAADSSKQSVEAMLAAEVAELKDRKKARFKRHETNVRGTAFVELPKAEGCPTPEEVAAEIAKHVRATQSLPSRHVMRIIPVSHTCFVSEDDLKVLATKVAEQHFPKDSDSIQFAIDFEHRACEKLKRKDVIDTIANAVPQPPHKVNLNAPQKTIVVQLVRNVCAVGVVDGYKDLLRMNLRKLADGDEPAAKQTKAGAEKTAETAAVPAEVAAGDQQDAGAAADADKAAAS
eukprot:GHUV01013284.1.p1 GENE.GHUV01013284.1~~GHUV01013284.1.p1  ORF type:complete len:251 (+),score=109.78 GHUV01013284.1:275-1027(+)